jgi:hypothetical protein
MVTPWFLNRCLSPALDLQLDQTEPIVPTPTLGAPDVGASWSGIERRVAGEAFAHWFGSFDVVGLVELLPDFVHACVELIDPGAVDEALP